MAKSISFFPKNVFGGFSILFFMSGAIIPLQNLRFFVVKNIIIIQLTL